MKSAFWDKLIQRLDRLDPGNLQTFVERLARERGFLETLFQSIQEGIVVLDGDGGIRYSNRAAQELIGMGSDAAQSGHPIERFLPDVGWAEILGAEHQTSSGVLARELEVFFPRHRFLSFYLLPIDADIPASDIDQGILPPMAWALIIRDVTEVRRQTEDAIQRESLSALTLLSAGVAHELGNPLNSLNIHLQLLKRELGELPPTKQEELGELVQVAIDNVQRLDHIISRFLKAVRPTAPQLKPCDLGAIITEVLEFLSRELHDRGIVIEQTMDPNLPIMVLDGDQIKQALFNLVRNALQAMPHGGRLGIRLDWDDDRSRALLSISDNGVGIPKDHMGRLFDPYWTSKPEGTGLGLMIVHRIVTEHGGEIEVRSIEGQGTEFKLFLPQRSPRLRMLKSGEYADQAAGESEKTISEDPLNDDA
jgi:signal transduction histidine kinase